MERFTIYRAGSAKKIKIGCRPSERVARPRTDPPLRPLLRLIGNVLVFEDSSRGELGERSTFIWASNGGLLFAAGWRDMVIYLATPPETVGEP
jgi:hypothetical protein